MLVFLRLAIGWHFFKEGVSHKVDPSWSSEGFLRAAKGPLAKNYQSMVSDFHGWDRLMLAPLTDTGVGAENTPPAKSKTPKISDVREAKTAEAKPIAAKPIAAKSTALKVVVEEARPAGAKSSETKPEAANSVGIAKAAVDKDASVKSGPAQVDAPKGDAPKSDAAAKDEAKPDTAADASKRETPKPTEPNTSSPKIDPPKEATETPATVKAAQDVKDKEEPTKPVDPKGVADESKPKITEKASPISAIPPRDAPPAAINSSGKPAKPSAAEVPPQPWDEWLRAAGQDWKAEAEEVADYYKFSAAQRESAAELLRETNALMKAYLQDIDPEARLYRQLSYRAQQMADGRGINETPFMKARASAIQKNPLNEKGISGSAIEGTPASWMAEAKAIEKTFHDNLLSLVSAEQVKDHGALPNNAPLHRVDKFVMWLLIICGGCLIVGLFTRLAAVAGAAFLLSVILSQPPWVADAVPTYNQVVECIALLALATTAVGRCAGLDYFIHSLVRPCCSAERKQA